MGGGALEKSLPWEGTEIFRNCTLKRKVKNTNTLFSSNLRWGIKFKGHGFLDPNQTLPPPQGMFPTSNTNYPHIQLLTLNGVGDQAAVSFVFCGLG